MEKSLARYIWSATKLQQLWILLVVAISMIPYFLAFDLPKQIINGPIQGHGFTTPETTQTFMRIAVPLPWFGEVELFDGLQLNRMQTLVGLSLVFLLLVIVNGLFKFYINTYKGRLGERMLRRIRYELIDRVLRFPPAHFKRIRSPEIATMIKDEVEPMGGFTGDAFVQPALLGGQALTALAFILMQNLWLGMIAAAMVAIQGFIIPKMRKRLLVLGRERQLTARELAGRVGEIVDGIHVIHSNDTSNYERADIARRLGRIFSIRYDLYQWKFLVKFINNFLAQVTPFLFYMIGGFLALQGHLNIGQLVSIINAYKDLPGPLKELIDWDQQRQDVQVKYNQVVEQFSVDNLVDPAIQKVQHQPVAALNDAIHLSNVSVRDDGGAILLEHVTTEIRPHETVAVIGTAGSGSETFAEMLGRFVWPESGQITIAGRTLQELPESVSGRRIAYASADTYFFHGSLRDNLLYGLKHAPLTEVDYQGKESSKRNWDVNEARLAKNPTFDLNSDWVDYQAMGIAGRAQLFGVVKPVLDAVMMTEDIMLLALRSRVHVETHRDITDHILELRQAFRQKLRNRDRDDLVVPFDIDAYNIQAPLGENLLFGALDRSIMPIRAVASHPVVANILAQSGLRSDLYTMGLEIAETIVDLLRDLPPEHSLFQQLTIFPAEDLPYYQTLLQKLLGKSMGAASLEEQIAIIRLSFSYIEPRYRFGLLTPEMQERIVRARKEIIRELPTELRPAIEPYEPEIYNNNATLVDNVLFGKVSYGQANAVDIIREILIELFDELNIYPNILSIGLDFDVGTGGKRLTAVQRQKINLARALLKKADYVVLNKPLPALDQRVRDEIGRNIVTGLRSEDYAPAIIWVLNNFALSELFDRVVVFDEGHIVQDSAQGDLDDENGVFKQLTS